MYVIDPSGGALFTFNMESLEYKKVNTTIPMNVSDKSCIASSNSTRTLYIIGGENASQTVQVLDLDTMSWLNDIPPTNYHRESHGCYVEPSNQRLYVMGGNSTKIEYINSTDIQNQHWTVLSDEFESGIMSFGMAANILVLGGCDENGIIGDVYSVNTVTNTVTRYDNALPYDVSAASAIGVDGTLYAFGGNNGGDNGSGSIRSWISYSMSCGLIFVEINNFNAFSSADIERNDSLQFMMANITYFAIAETAEIFGIDAEDFYVNFRNVSQPLSMVLTLCALTSPTFQGLKSIITGAADEISASMEKSIISLYDLDANGTMDVVIDVEPIESSITSDDTNESYVPWILLIVVIVMVAFMSIIVVFLWMRRKNIRLQNSMKKPSVQEMEVMRQATAESMAISQSSVSERDIEGRAEGMETANRNETVHEGYVRMSDV